MKAIAAILAVFVSSASAQTVIYYEDGTTYTVQPNENVYVETAKKMYRKKSYKNGNEYFTHATPSEKVDYEPEAHEGMEPGSDEWCEAYAPHLYANGFTFDDQLYLRACVD